MSTTKSESTSEDVNALVAERNALARRVAEAEEKTLAYWVEAVVVSSAGSMTVKELQQSVSWRVTRPLRAAKIVSNNVRTSGVRQTVGMVRIRLAQIRQARKRG
jgi:hypothetical protein